MGIQFLSMGKAKENYHQGVIFHKNVNFPYPSASKHPLSVFCGLHSFLRYSYRVSVVLVLHLMTKK